MINAAAQLWIGSPQQTLACTYTFLQKRVCQAGGCGTCVDCQKITAQQHHQVMWLAPTPTYTLETLDPLLETIACAQATQQDYFFIVQQADFLTAACANRLLKIVEEPPPGYVFIFLAQRPALVIDTIRSRCVMHTISAQQHTDTPPAHPLFTLFTHGQLDATSLITILDKTPPSEIESMQLIDALLAYWSQQPANDRVQATVTVLQHALLKPPMPGSSKIFWRNVFMQLSQNVRAQTGSVVQQPKMGARTY